MFISYVRSININADKDLLSRGLVQITILSVYQQNELNQDDKPEKNLNYKNYQ
ncbi:unnamed protein product [Paramecium sonneborni]|uniref:Uncharacterized protein n=1 Tax=Paramecium sonneborni TaxID=65129 RepID=A0A8S1NV62_9CILI|nr:unnamed protein product [Paramecium sonneborni]